MNGAPLQSGIHDGVLYVRLDRPEKRNALSNLLLTELGAAFRQNAANETLIAAVLTGAGDKAFAAGGDLHELDSLRSAEQGRAMALFTRSIFDTIRQFPVPVIAALNGDALGGGAELTVACDFRVAASHARIGFIQGGLAMATAWGGGAALHRIVGRQTALRLLTTARILPAGEALRLGLIDAVAGEGEALDDAVEAFLAPARKIVPQVHRAHKALALAMDDRTGPDAVELDHFASCWVHEDHWTAHDRFVRKQTGASA